jgi:chaperonin GroEL
VKLKLGDGSTTAILLTHALVRGGVKAIASGVHPRGVELGMEEAVAQALELLRAAATPVSGRDEVERVARAAAGGDDELAALVAEALERAGGGHVGFEPSRRRESSLEVRTDYAIDRGLLAPQFVTDQELGQAILDDALVLIADAKIASGRELAPALDVAAGAGRPLLLIAEGFEADAMATLTINVINHKVVAVPVESPGYGESRRETFGDVAALTGATVLGGADGPSLAGVRREHLGEAGRVTVAKRLTRIADGRGQREMLGIRAGAIGRLADAADNVHDRDELEQRRASLDGKGVAIIGVGGSTETEVRGRTRAGQDALSAARSALAHGVLPGGATALVQTAAALERRTNGHGGDRDGERAGFDIVREALVAPLRSLASSAGAEPGEIVQRVREAPPGHGYDIESGGVSDLLAAGVVDSAGVVCGALESAAYVAKRVIGTEVLVVQPIYAGKYLGTAAEGGPANLAMP